MDAENTQNLSSEELEDVEAHGLKEVALGLGAAAVIGGGSAGVALASSSASSPASHPVPASQTVQHLKQGVESTISRHTPQGPPTASAEQNRTLPRSPSLPIHHVMPSSGDNAPVSKPGAAVKEAAERTVKDAVDIAKQPLVSPFLQAPPAQP